MSSSSLVHCQRLAPFFPISCLSPLSDSPQSVSPIPNAFCALPHFLNLFCSPFRVLSSFSISDFRCDLLLFLSKEQTVQSLSGSSPRLLQNRSALERPAHVSPLLHSFSSGLSFAPFNGKGLDTSTRA